MISHKLKVIEQMVEGNGLSGDYEELLIQGVSIDSRSVQSGNLFIPIIRQLDAHDYVEEALTKGATASLWQKDHPNPPIHLPLIYVDDCMKSLQMLAANYRKELPIKVIGVTGSNGKTTTKDMISSVLETKYRVHKTVGNLNSQIGLPLTILEIDKSTEVAVVEMGMSERGQMGRLSLIAKPDIAVITMIGVSHLSSLGSREEIAAAKLEIIDGLQDDGILIYNGDEPLFIPLLGAHNVINAVATIAVATTMGLSPTEIDMGFQSLRVTSMRMEKILSTLGFTIINDAWNASPISMSAAIKTFEELTGYSRKHLVLGDMLELGEQEQEFHRDIGRMIDPVKIDFVYTVGNLSKYIAFEAEKRFPVGGVQAYNDKKELAQVLKNRVMPNDAIMLKGSRGIQLESLLPNLL